MSSNLVGENQEQEPTITFCYFLSSEEKKELKETGFCWMRKRKGVSKDLTGQLVRIPGAEWVCRVVEVKYDPNIYGRADIRVQFVREGTSEELNSFWAGEGEKY